MSKRATCQLISCRRIAGADPYDDNSIVVAFDGTFGAHANLKTAPM